MAYNNLRRYGTQKGGNGSTGGGSVFTQDIPVNLTGGKSLGRYLNGQTVPAIGKTPQEVFLDIASEYLPPAFSSFVITSQPTIVEVGTILSGNKTFTWGTTNSGNVQANSIKITDVTNAVDIATAQPNDGSQVVALPTPIVKNTLASHSWRASGINTNAIAFQSSLFTVNWQFRRFAGTSNNVTLIESEIEALAINSIAGNSNGTYALAAGGYKFFAWPDAYGSPTAVTGIKDTSTGFAVQMADSTDDPFFSNTQNGWPYGLISITNALGVVANYRVYRTRNVLNGTINIAIS